MKILQICKKFPYPMKDGESIAVNYLSKSLVELGCQVSLLTMNTTKHYFDMKEVPDALSHYHTINHVEVDNNITVTGAFLNLFTSDSYHISRYRSKLFENKLVDILTNESFDVIHLETLYVTQFIDIIRKYSNAMIVLRSHNVEFEIWERLADNEARFLKKSYLRYLTSKLRRFEIAQLQKIDLLLAITQRDLKTFRRLGYLGPAKIVPIGLDTADYLAAEKSLSQFPAISFIGSLDWIPNVEGLEWFLKDIWPKLSQKYPKLQFHVAGRNTPDFILNRKDKNVTIHGEVSDAKSFLNAYPITVVPLMSGSGMRVKILEGMFLGRVVITTALGLEGIDAQHKNQVLIAETVEEFVKAIDFCFEHPSQIQNISRRAQVFAARHYDNLEIGKDLVNYYRQHNESYPVALTADV